MNEFPHKKSINGQKIIPANGMPSGSSPGGQKVTKENTTDGNGVSKKWPGRTVTGAGSNHWTAKNTLDC